MKKIFSSLLLFLFIISGTQAKIWRVNNNPGVLANFTTAQAAHDGAGAGDTLHFEPSPNAYGNLTMTKKLVIIGIGDFLAINPNNQASGVPATLNSITVNAGGDNSTIMVSAIEINVNNAQGVIIQRCFISSEGVFESIKLNNASNTVIRNCFAQRRIALNGASTTVQIINNIIGGGFDCNYNIFSNNIK